MWDELREAMDVAHMDFNNVTPASRRRCYVSCPWLAIGGVDVDPWAGVVEVREVQPKRGFPWFRLVRIKRCSACGSVVPGRHHPFSLVRWR